MSGGDGDLDLSGDLSGDLLDASDQEVKVLDVKPDIKVRVRARGFLFSGHLRIFFFRHLPIFLGGTCGFFFMKDDLSAQEDNVLKNRTQVPSSFNKFLH